MHMTACQHTDRNAVARVCRHLPEQKELDYIQRFTGKGHAYDLVCGKCREEPDAIDARLVHVCAECFRTIEASGSWEGILGSPELRIGTCSLQFQHETVELPSLTELDIIDIQPIDGSEGLWLACTSKGSLIEIDTLGRSVRAVAQVPHEALDFDGQFIREARASWTRGPRCVLRVSRTGDMAAVANTYGERGIVLDLVTGQVSMSLRRDKYHEDVCVFPLAFCESNNRLLVIHGTEWNRLDASDAMTGALLTHRQPTSYKKGEPRPPHYLDYFHCQLTVSPGQQFVADNGWVWTPVGVITAWSLGRWLHENVWESEDGETKKRLCWRWYYWDGPLCWIDDYRLAVWGYGQDDEWLIPAVRVFDVRTGEQERWFAGPKGSLVFDDYLFSFDQTVGLAAWDVATGERLVHEPSFCPAGYHRGAKHFLSLLGGGRMRISRLLRE